VDTLNVPQQADFGGFLYDPTQPSQRDMPTVTQTLCQLPTLANGLEVESWQNLPDLENQLLHQCRTVALRRVIFKWKKRFMTIR
jgi:hypothetical protein